MLMILPQNGDGMPTKKTYENMSTGRNETKTTIGDGGTVTVDGNKKSPSMMRIGRSETVSGTVGKTVARTVTANVTVIANVTRCESESETVTVNASVSMNGRGIGTSNHDEERPGSPV